MSDLNDLEYCQQRIAELEAQLATTETKLSHESEKRQAEDDKNAGLNDRFNHLLQLLPAGLWSVVQNHIELLSLCRTEFSFKVQNVHETSAHFFYFIAL